MDDYMTMFAPKDVQSLKLAEEYGLQRTKESCIRTLIHTKDKRVFASPKYRALKSSSKLSITQGKVKLALTACDEICASVAQQNCQHGYLIHPPFSFKGHTDTICCRKEGPLEVLNRLRNNELSMLKATLDSSAHWLILVTLPCRIPGVVWNPESNLAFLGCDKINSSVTSKNASMVNFADGICIWRKQPLDSRSLAWNN